jgi:transposase
MSGKPTQLLVLTDAERQTLQVWAHRRTTEQRLAVRAQIVLASAAGDSNTAIAQRLGIDRKTVERWRSRFIHRRLAGLVGKPRPGVRRRIIDVPVQESLL